MNLNYLPPDGLRTEFVQFLFFDKISSENKMELGLIKEEEKEQRLAAKKNREEGSLPAENQS